MKNQLNEELFAGMEAMPMNESLEVMGGESAWYWIGYGIGQVGRFVGSLSGAQTGK